MPQNSVIDRFIQGRIIRRQSEESAARIKQAEEESKRQDEELKLRERELLQRQKQADEVTKRLKMQMDLDLFKVKDILRQEAGAGERQVQGGGIIGGSGTRGIQGFLPPQEQAIAAPGASIEGPFGPIEIEQNELEQLRAIETRKRQRGFEQIATEAELKERPRRLTNVVQGNITQQRALQLEDFRQAGNLVRDKKRHEQRLNEIRLRADLGSSDEATNIASIADDVAMLRVPLTQVLGKQRNAVSNALRKAGLAVPNPKAVSVLEGIGGLPEFQQEMEDLNSLLQKRDVGEGILSRLGARVSGGIETTLGTSEIAARRSELLAKAALIAKRARGESGNPSNADIQRMEKSFPGPQYTDLDNARRTTQLFNEIEGTVNTQLSSIPINQRQAIFESRGFNLQAREPKAKSTLSIGGQSTDTKNELTEEQIMKRLDELNRRK